jgi:hypothetical protein
MYVFIMIDVCVCVCVCGRVCVLFVLFIYMYVCMYVYLLEKDDCCCISYRDFSREIGLLCVCVCVCVFGFSKFFEPTQSCKPRGSAGREKLLG